MNGIVHFILIFLLFYLRLMMARSVKEVVSTEEGKLWKKAMVEEMEALDKNEA